MKKTSLIFPGQGSQRVGMLAAMAARYPIIQETFAESSQVLGYDLWQRIQQGPEELLNQTECTQPALLTASISLWRVWLQEDKVKPFLLAGHSLGEYSALVCAGSLTFTDAVSLVEKRGQCMQAAVPQGAGAIAAIVGLDDEKIASLCLDASNATSKVVPANYNAPGQVVVAGHADAVERVLALAKIAGAKLVKILPMSVPSHCDMMRDAAAQFSRYLNAVAISPPTISVIHNADVDTHTHPDDIREILVRQLYSPVRWVETICRMEQEGVVSVYECGPGKILCGLVKRIAKALECESLEVNE